MLEFIKRQDYYSETPAFKIKGEDGYKTLLGGVLFIIYFVIYFFLTLYYLINNYTNYKPIVSSISEASDYSIEHTFNHDIFQVAVSMFEEGKQIKPMKLSFTSEISHEKISAINNQYIHENIGEFIECKVLENNIINNAKANDSALGHRNLNVDNNTEGPVQSLSSTIQSRLDSNLYPYSSFKQYLKVLENHSYCASFHDDIKVGGDLVNSGVKNNIIGHFDIDTCKIDEMNTDICSDNIKLSKFSKDKKLYWVMAFKNNHLTPDLKEGYSAFTDSIVGEFDLGSDHEIVMTYSKNILSTDNNFIFDFVPPQEITFPTFTIMHRLIPKDSNPDKVKIFLKLKLSNFDVNHSRGYVKLDSIIANIQAITYLVDVFFISLCQFFHYGKMDIFIANKAYQIFDNPETVKSNRRNSSIVSNILKNNIVNNNNNVNSNKHKYSNLYGKSSNFDSRLNSMDNTNNIRNLELNRNKTLGLELEKSPNVNSKINNEIVYNDDINRLNENESKKDKKVTNISNLELHKIDNNDVMSINSKEAFNNNYLTVKNKDNQNTHQILSKIDKANNDNISNKSNKNTNTIKNINYVRNQLKKDELKTNLLETLITELCPWIPCFKKLSNKHKTDAKKKYLIASAYLSYDLDIITYLRNIQILEKLRDYTLSEDKKSLMNLDSRRLINSDFNLEEIEEKLEKDIEKFDDLNDSFVENIAIALSKTSDNPLLKLNDNQNK